MVKITLLTALLLIASVCSFRVPLEPRIVGGIKASNRVAPFIVSLQYNEVHNCGGSILNEHWILTAGHCLLDAERTKNMKLVAGLNNLKMSMAESVQKRNIDYYKVHSKYKGGTEPYDIGLIYTAKPFVWSQTVKPVQLPKQGYEAKGFANLYGWGSISKDTIPRYPKELMQAINLPILSLDRCKWALNDISTGMAKFLDTTNICTGPVNRGIQACSADSGGPLVEAGKSRLLIGVVSWGPLPCGRAPSVFVKVADFIVWIEEQQNIYDTRKL